MAKEWKNPVSQVKIILMRCVILLMHCLREWKLSGIIGVNEFRKALEKNSQCICEAWVKSKTSKLLSWVSGTH